MVVAASVLICCYCMKSRHQSEHNSLMYYRFICSITGGGSKKHDGEKKKEDVLNIFSVASGHLYERFLRSDILLSHFTVCTLCLLILDVKIKVQIP